MLSRKVAARLMKGDDDEDEEGMAKSLIRRILGVFCLSVRASSFTVIAMTGKRTTRKEREREDWFYHWDHVTLD